VGMVEHYVREAVRAERDIADTAHALQNDVVAYDLSVLDLQQMELLFRQAAGEQAITPLREMLAGVERNRRDRDRWRPLMSRRLNPFLEGAFADDRAVVIDAEAHDRPAIVQRWANEIDFVAAARPMLGGPELAGDRMHGETLRVAMAVAPDRGHRTGSADERIVWRNRAVVAQTMNLPVGRAEILRERFLTPVADAEEQIFAREDEPRAEVMPNLRVDIRWGAINGLLVAPDEPVETAADDARHCAVGSGIGIREIDPAVFGELRVCLHGVQTALAPVPHSWRAFDRTESLAARSE